MFLINSVYTAELNSKDIEEKVNNKKPKKIEMQILNKINRLEESILPKEQVQPKIKENGCLMKSIINVLCVIWIFRMK